MNIVHSQQACQVLDPIMSYALCHSLIINSIARPFLMSQNTLMFKIKNIFNKEEEKACYGPDSGLVHELKEGGQKDFRSYTFCSSSYHFCYEKKSIWYQKEASLATVGYIPSSKVLFSSIMDRMYMLPLLSIQRSPHLENIITKSYNIFHTACKITEKRNERAQ